MNDTKAAAVVLGSELCRRRPREFCDQSGDTSDESDSSRSSKRCRKGSRSSESGSNQNCSSNDGDNDAQAATCTTSSSKTAGTGSSCNVPSFLVKTFAMISSGKHSDCIRWSASGEEFEVLNTHKCATEVFPQYFRHSNFSSFIRQLNFYGFSTVPSCSSTVERVFSHPLFKKDQPDLLTRVHRKKTNDKKQCQQGIDKALQNFKSDVEVCRDFQSSIHEFMREIQGQACSLRRKVCEAKSIAHRHREESKWYCQNMKLAQTELMQCRQQCAYLRQQLQKLVPDFQLPPAIPETPLATTPPPVENFVPPECAQFMAGCSSSSASESSQSSSPMIKSEPAPNALNSAFPCSLPPMPQPPRIPTQCQTAFRIPSRGRGAPSFAAGRLQPALGSQRSRSLPPPPPTTRLVPKEEPVQDQEMESPPASPQASPQPPKRPCPVERISNSLRSFVGFKPKDRSHQGVRPYTANPVAAAPSRGCEEIKRLFSPCEALFAVVQDIMGPNAPRLPPNESGAVDTTMKPHPKT